MEEFSIRDGFLMIDPNVMVLINMQVSTQEVYDALFEMALLRLQELMGCTPNFINLSEV